MGAGLADGRVREGGHLPTYNFASLGGNLPSIPSSGGNRRECLSVPIYPRDHTVLEGAVSLAPWGMSGRRSEKSTLQPREDGACAICRAEAHREVLGARRPRHVIYGAMFAVATVGANACVVCAHAW